MRHTLQLVAIATLLTTAATMHAQITNPDDLVAHAPRNPARPQADTAPRDFQWLWQYTSPAATGNKSALLLDARFHTLLADNLHAPQAMWGLGVPLSEAAQDFLAGPGSVTSTDNRRIVMTGCITDPDTHACTQRGMLYIDLTKTPQPLILFTALRWVEQSKTPSEPNAPFNLWIFPSQSLAAERLPESFHEDLRHLAEGTCPRPSIANVLIVEPSGVPQIEGLAEVGLGPTPDTCTTTLNGGHS
jgi:hypothetical protein